MTQITTGVDPYTGLNTTNIINALMTDAQQPLNQLTTQMSTDKSKISAYGQIASALTAFQTAADALAPGKPLTSSTAASSDTTTVNATGTALTGAGTYNIAVQKLAQDEQLTSAPLSSTSTVFKTGTLTINAGGKQTDININIHNNTLSGLANAINSSNAGVTAAIINDNPGGGSTTDGTGNITSGPRLVITGSGLGANGNISIYGNDLGPVGASLGQFNYDSEFGNPGNSSMSVTQQGQNGQFTINGTQVTSTSNTNTTAVAGLTLNLNKLSASTGSGSGIQYQPTQVTVSNAPVSSSGPLQNFVTAYNNVLSTLNSVTAQGQPLANNQTATDLIRQLNNITTTSYGGGTLAEFGIMHNAKDGTLTIDTSTMNKSTTADGGAGLTNVVNNMSTSLHRSLNNVLYTIIPDQESTLNQDVNRLTDRQTSMNETLTQTKTALTAKFTAMSQTVAALQSQLSSISSLSGTASNSVMTAIQNATGSAQANPTSTGTTTGSNSTLNSLLNTTSGGTTTGTSGG
ncbi:MAG: flagellar filament capping protein FliD [Nitrospirae bacterium]|nr:flagellar filament capping protein FliD [Nitrospirota bacterium]